MKIFGFGSENLRELRFSFKTPLEVMSFLGMLLNREGGFQKIPEIFPENLP